MRIILLLALFLTSLFSYDENYSYRKYSHVKDFYKVLIKDVVKIALKYNIPPASVLAIAGIESGYGSGYISKVTGNILSLGAFKGDYELPALYLPKHKKTQKTIYNNFELFHYKENELEWIQRNRSLKRDYRPIEVAGKTTGLDVFDYQERLKIEANLKNVEDFCTRWISANNTFSIFRKAKAYLEENIKKHGKDILFDQKLNEEFIQMIGGKPNSFNPYETWAPKVITVIRKVGLSELTYQIYKEKEFDKVW